MILRRLGNKQKIAKDVQVYFPNHKTYIEPFFGAGGMFFNKPKVKYNILNDLDSDVFNLFQVVMNQKDELKKTFYIMPIHSGLLDYWKENKETEPIRKALRFLFLSNYTLMGTGTSMRGSSTEESKQNIEKNIDKVHKHLEYSKLFNFDFVDFFRTISFRRQSEIDGAFIYADPPYLNTNDNYSNSFTEEQSNSLFDTLIDTGCKFAMSEFDNPFIIEQAQKRGLNIIYISERQNLKNRRTEILVTNYENRQQSLFA
jgi:DNA adenine methylase